MKRAALASAALIVASAAACTAPAETGQNASGGGGSSDVTAQGPSTPTATDGSGSGTGGEETATAASGGDGGDGGDPTCQAVRAATVADRALLGEASPYPADGTLRGREAELAASPIIRREVAWSAALRALSPVQLGLPLPGAPDATLPRFHTWYTKEDVSRLFHHLYGSIGDSRRAARDPFTDDELDDAFVWNPHAVEEDPTWPEDRFDAYVASLDEDAEIAGIGGISRTAYSPAAARHLLRSYTEIVGCDGATPPPPVTDAPSTGPRRMVHEAVSLEACERRTWGPYFVGNGETLVAAATGAARLEVTDDEGAIVCTALEGESCEAGGPGALHVATTAFESGPVTLDIDYEEANPEWASCLKGPFPLDAAIVKASFSRVWPGDPLPTYETSPSALAARMQGDASWNVADGFADPGPESIYTVTTPSGATYRLAGLHLMTKELDHWLWVSLWWSPDPDEDLGADRPAAVADLDGPWKGYKMCVVSAFAEADGEDGADGAPSWCSNPYLEQGHGNASSNCIGCHQHGGTGLDAQTILDTMPAFGRTPIRNNFPADYSWGLDQGDRLLRMFSDEVDWWDAGD